MEAIGQVIHLILWLFIALLWVRFVFDWVQVFARSWSPKGPLLVLLELVYSVTDPPIKMFRRFIPPLRVGPVALDFGFALTMLLCFILLAVTRSLTMV